MDHKSHLPSTADFARIEGQLFDRIAVRYRRQVLRHRLVAVAAVLVVAGAGVAAGTIANPTQQSNFAYCYDGANTGANVADLGLPTNEKFTTGHSKTATAAQVATALALCKSVWRDGGFIRSSAAGPYPVPNLQVCLRDDLIISVFRKTDTGESADAFCSNLGLSAP
jgi:hypothetical protein